ncbi:ribonuclease PH, partial [Francisella tularensis subsp. holarctica]|nr:ribonuclease PH [Francisella tularensis subsp. holarctica]
NGGIIEIQGTDEGKDFSEEEFSKMLGLAKKGIKEIFATVF